MLMKELRRETVFSLDTEASAEAALCNLFLQKVKEKLEGRKTFCTISISFILSIDFRHLFPSPFSFFLSFLLLSQEDSLFPPSISLLERKFLFYM